MTEGEVRDVQTDRTDKYWSINIKKGLLSLLQLKINGRSTITDTESLLPDSSLRSRNRFYDMVNPLARRSRLGFSRATDNIFKVMEVCIYFTLFFVYILVTHELNVHKRSQQHNKVTKHLLLPT